MNQHSSTDSSTSTSNGASADVVSRRAYEIWEGEGRPEGCDLRHWLQAEQELGSYSDNGRKSENGDNSRPSADTRPLAGTRGGAAPAARDQKRPANTPPSGEKNGTGSVSGQNSAKRKPSSAPVL